MNNGYFNSYEMEQFPDFAFIRKETKFKKAIDTANNRVYPCKNIPRARDFDFWIGEWDVFNNSYPNHRVGSSVIQNVSGECTILENWQSWNNPFSGKSQNWYDLILVNGHSYGLTPEAATNILLMLNIKMEPCGLYQKHPAPIVRCNLPILFFITWDRIK